MTKNKRQYSPLDQICLGLDQALRAMVGTVKTTDRIYPALGEKEPTFTHLQRKQAAGLMRVNHAGEVAAQALYHGQGLVSKNPVIQKQMQQSAIEEGDHLAWCSKRLTELGSHPSYLNPVWYAGSFAIGMAAGLVGDRWSLGFVAETEQQVVKHLESHVRLLPPEDHKSIKILQQMQIDELHHREEAIKAGAVVLPFPIKKLMALTSKIMVKVAFWI
ncbi:MAG: 2-polyprenyl-3-methyl-6-methoxy-1,4-benzoquinone monooxygenase [Gammaproteobacteria bacterium]|nr:2-polyprenyl-3-methyl-6-methoxy-1,4-benzoquinone monooxygenase [Gammaproteobacteria bacterium]